MARKKPSTSLLRTGAFFLLLTVLCFVAGVSCDSPASVVGIIGAIPLLLLSAMFFLAAGLARTGPRSDVP